jgi:hypothetical protein
LDTAGAEVTLAVGVAERTVEHSCPCEPQPSPTANDERGCRHLEHCDPRNSSSNTVTPIPRLADKIKLPAQCSTMRVLSKAYANHAIRITLNIG